jgi:hypothetical protein
MITVTRRDWLFWLGVTAMWGPALSTGTPNPWLWWGGHALIALSFAWGPMAVYLFMMIITGYIMAQTFAAPLPWDLYFYALALSILAGAGLTAWGLKAMRSAA